MGQKEILKKENFEKNTKKDLKNYYKYTYKCKKCNSFYGDDQEESEPYLCPVCEEKK